MFQLLLLSTRIYLACGLQYLIVIIIAVCGVCVMFAELYECVIAVNRTENSERRMLKLKKLLHELPDHNFETFRFLAQHLNKVAAQGEQNKVGTFVS